MTSLIVGIVLIVGGIAFAAAPFFRRREAADPAPTLPEMQVRHPAPATDAERPPARDAEAPTGSMSLAAQLEELDLDRAMGKLSETDYGQLRTAMERRDQPSTTSVEEARADTIEPIAATRSSADTLAKGDDSARPDDEIASPPLASTASAAAGNALDVEAERLVRSLREVRVSCRSCGPRPEPGAQFCSNCGSALGGCPGCGQPIAEADARFCDRCGTPLIG